MPRVIGRLSLICSCLSCFVAQFDDPVAVIGEGSFGVVLLCEYRGTKVALKKAVRERKAKSNPTPTDTHEAKQTTMKFTVSSASLVAALAAPLVVLIPLFAHQEGLLLVLSNLQWLS